MADCQQNKEDKTEDQGTSKEPETANEQNSKSESSLHRFHYLVECQFICVYFHIKL